MLGLHLFKKEQSNVEREKLLFLIKEVNFEVSTLKNKISLLETNIADLRGRLNRRLDNSKKEEEKKEEDINKTVFLSPNGTPI